MVRDCGKDKKKLRKASIHAYHINSFFCPVEAANTGHCKAAEEILAAEGTDAEQRSPNKEDWAKGDADSLLNEGCDDAVEGGGDHGNKCHEEREKSGRARCQGAPPIRKRRVDDRQEGENPPANAEVEYWPRPAMEFLKK